MLRPIPRTPRPRSSPPSRHRVAFGLGKSRRQAGRGGRTPSPRATVGRGGGGGEQEWQPRRDSSTRDNRGAGAGDEHAGAVPRRPQGNRWASMGRRRHVGLQGDTPAVNPCRVCRCGGPVPCGLPVGGGRVAQQPRPGRAVPGNRHASGTEGGTDCRREAAQPVCSTSRARGPPDAPSHPDPSVL